jgi:uncharacterized membrane protein
MPVIPLWTGAILVGLLALWLGLRLIHRGKKRYTSDRQRWWMD